MPEIILSLTFDKSSKIIFVSGLSAEDVKIDYSADIDFTPLVESLLESVASDNSFALQLTSTDNHDEKDKLVERTIVEIIAKYNEIVVVAPEESGEGNPLKV